MDKEFTTHEQDRVARKLLMTTMPMRPETPRNAYAIHRGADPSDEEWSKFGAAWERNWDECVELYKIVSEAEEVLRAAYANYVAAR